MLVRDRGPCHHSLSDTCSVEPATSRQADMGPADDPVATIRNQDPVAGIATSQRSSKIALIVDVPAADLEQQVAGAQTRPAGWTPRYNMIDTRAPAIRIREIDA